MNPSTIHSLPVPLLLDSVPWKRSQSSMTRHIESTRLHRMEARTFSKVKLKFYEQKKEGSMINMEEHREVPTAVIQGASSAVKKTFISVNLKSNSVDEQIQPEG